MSPNEFQLRSALRDGEGDHVDADTVIARARGMQQARHDRRVRYGSVAAAVAVVGGIGVIGSLALGGGHDGNASTAGKGGGVTNADGAGNYQGTGRGATAPSSRAVPAAAGPMADAAAVPCPTTPPNLALPGGGGSGQFGANGALFDKPVVSVKVCAYPRTGSSTASTVLAGGTATSLTESLEAAAKTVPEATKCPVGPAPADRGSLVIIGVDKGGQQLKPVVVTLTCPSRVTNGTALRFNWTPPANLIQLINQAGRAPGSAPISLPPPGKVTGSPIRS